VDEAVGGDGSFVLGFNEPDLQSQASAALRGALVLFDVFSV